MDALEPIPERVSPPSDPAPTGDAGAHPLPTAAQGASPANFRPAALTPPFVLGHYRVVEIIGEGGMGAVYRAMHGRLKKAVALKLLPAARTADSQAITRFEREMEAIGRLNHNNIVRATDAGEADGVHYLVMELIDGVDLARLVRHSGPLPVADACELVRQAAAGLQYAYENRLVHRDIKPSNLLLSASGELKITDLGLALLNHNGAASGELTVTGQVMGTADYMAPEQWEDSHTVDIRADLYSLGCTLYTLLIGKPPFGGPKHRSALRKMAAHAKERVQPVTDQRADVPPALEELRLRLMAKEPAERPSTPAQVVKALEPFCRGADLAALARAALARPRPDAPAAPDLSTETRNAAAVLSTPACGQTLTATPGPRVGRRRAWPMMAAGAFLLLLLVGAASYGLWPWTPRSAPPDNQPPPAAPPTPPAANIGGWQNLLAVRPTERMWVPAAIARVDYDPAAEAMRIDAASPSLFKLGETEARGYKILVGFRQLTWTGGVGVYFGGRPSPGPGVFRFQYVQLCPVNPNEVAGFRLGRSVGLIHQNPAAGPQLEKLGFLSALLPDAPDNSEQMLELEVRQRGLADVRWNSRPCPQLVADAERLRLADPLADDRGEFGIYVAEATNVIVSTARFMKKD